MQPSRSSLKDVAVVADHPMSRIALCSVVSSSATFRVTVEADLDRDGMHQVRSHEPDLTLVSVDRWSPEHLELLEAASEVSRVLLITDRSDVVVPALHAGVQGVLNLPDFDAPGLLAALRAVLDGHVCVARPLIDAVIGRAAALSRTRPAPTFRMTSREAQVMDLVAEGLDNLQIAERLCLSEKTVKNYVSRAYARLGVSSRTQAALCWRAWLRDGGGAQPLARTS